MKKLFSLFFALIASVGTLIASENVDGIWYNFDVNTKTAEVTSDPRSVHFKYKDSVAIPSYVTYNNEIYTVTSIGYGAFHECSTMQSITIPNSVISIGDVAFVRDTSLTSVIIPNSVTSIGRSAFLECTGLASVSIGNSVTSIGERAFYKCSGLTTITVEASTPPILDGAVFASSQLKDIYVPCGTIETYKIADVWSTYASKIKYAPSGFSIATIVKDGSINVVNNICEASFVTAVPNRGYQFVRWGDGNTENPRTIELTQDTTMEAIFDYLLEGKCGKDSALTWKFNPSTMALDITGKGALSENYTYGTFIESLTIGNEVTLIGPGAFYRCNNLKNVIIGSSVKVLEESAFCDCSAIETITCYSQRPPTVNNYALYGLDYSTIVYVPADYLNTYVMHDSWGLYDVRPLGAKSTETTEVTVTPAENTAEVVWPTVSGAATYELVIKDKDGNIICTLIFNSNGQLTQIAFNAPARDHAPQQTQGTGFSFTVTGLDSGTGYDLTITAKDSNGSTLDTQTASFTTTSAQDIESVSAVHSESGKILRDGQILILRGDHTYTLTGQEIK